MDDLDSTHGLPYSGPDGFDGVYRSGAPPPWDIGRPQPALQALADAGLIGGKVLDAGCGTGEHALMAAALGLEATGLDFAATAVEEARGKAGARGLPVRFVEGDALDLPALGETFDTVIDCGLFHVLDDDQRSAYVQGVTAVTRPGGRYFLLCFNEHVPGDAGPRRIRQHEIRDAFAEGWRVDGIEASSITSTIGPPIPAWLASLTRT
ncbi:MAG: class I SAM-dependent methyltransferase [Actinomycetota bacterium]